MKKFILIAFFALAMIGTSFANERNLEPPSIDQAITYDDVMDQSDVLEVFGWEISKVIFIDQIQTEFLVITYAKEGKQIIFETSVEKNHSLISYKRLKSKYHKSINPWNSFQKYKHQDQSKCSSRLQAVKFEYQIGFS